MCLNHAMVLKKTVNKCLVGILSTENQHSETLQWVVLWVKRPLETCIMLVSITHNVVWSLSDYSLDDHLQSMGAVSLLVVSET